jgi:transposase
MTQATLQSERSAITGQLCVALELGGRWWKLTASSGGTKVTESSVAAGDLEGLRAKLRAAKARQGLASDAAVVSCYEAGRDGFWLHRELERWGGQNLVVDSASIEVNRRARRVKTDRLDGRKLLSMLWRYVGGERTVWRVVRVPSVADEDGRRLHRELDRLTKERTAHANRVRALLTLLGLGHHFGRRTVAARTAMSHVATLTQRDGTPLPPHLRAEIEREGQRWALVDRQIRELEGSRRQLGQTDTTVAAEQARQLTRLSAIGETTAWLLAQEVFAWRQIRNRREAGALVGLTPTPYASDGSQREQGVSKAGNRHVRRVLIQIAWGWLRHQPESRLSHWFQARFGHGQGRMRRVGIVALARRLFIALWRFVEFGVVPDGARLRAVGATA